LLINGRNSETLPVLDRGLLFGDGLFETIAFPGRDAPLWDRHMARLVKGCHVLGIESPDSNLLLDEARTLANDDRQIIKIIITRGEGGAGYFPAAGKMTRILYTRPWISRDPREKDAGIGVHLCQTRLARGSATAGLKTLNRLEQVLAAREAQDAGFQEAILCDAEGYLVEGLMSNLFWVLDGTLFTPDLDQCGVAGVMREFVIQTAEQAGREVHVVEARADALVEADVLFLTNATGMRVVSEFNGNQYDVRAVPSEISSAINRLLKTE
jgi:4-amino-4-deoxychorismate lyase